MIKKLKNLHTKGFSILEIILSVAIFSIFSAASVTFFLSALSIQQQSLQYSAAATYASAGIEAMRAVRDDSFDNLNNTDKSGLEFANGKWKLSGENDHFDIYTRVISISEVSRDGDGNVVTSGGITDSDMKKIVATVSWTDASGQTVSTAVETHLSRWK